jgi:hypothetical protein
MVCADPPLHLMYLEDLQTTCTMLLGLAVDYGCCRPSWFTKHRNHPSEPPARTIVYFAAGRTAMNI